MRERVKKLWLEALRSGKYEQGRLALRTVDNRFCCLGVLCDVYQKEMKRQKKKQLNMELSCAAPIPTQVYMYDNEECTLPKIVMKWSGVKGHLGNVRYMEENTNLADLNDDRAMTFKQIADVIEKNL